MFERFTDRARHAVERAQEEARELGHEHIGTEHILLGLLRDDESLGGRVLRELGVTVEHVYPHVSALGGRRDEVATGRIPFTPGAKKVLELALREALSLGHNYIGTEHILLGLARIEEGTGLLAANGVRYEDVRECVVRSLSLEQSGAPGRRRRPSIRAVQVGGTESYHLLAILAAFGLGVLVGKAVAH